MVAYVLLSFALIGIFQNSLGAMLPELIEEFSLSYAQAALMPSALLLAFGIVAVPAGLAAERWGERRIVIGSYACLAGAFALVCLRPPFPALLPLFFLIGGGLSGLQVSLIPLLKAASGARAFGIRLVLVQGIFGAASFLGPLLYGSLSGAGVSWRGMYLLFLGFSAAAILPALLLRFPKGAGADGEKPPTIGACLRFLLRPLPLLYFFGIALYVGLEQGTATWMAAFAQSSHGLSPAGGGAHLVAAFWGAFTLGNFAVAYALKRTPPNIMSCILAGSAALLLPAAVLGPALLSYAAFILLGAAAAPLWALVYALALEEIPAGHGILSGLLAAAVVGGAPANLLVGAVADRFGLRLGLLSLTIAPAFILYLGLRFRRRRPAAPQGRA